MDAPRNNKMVPVLVVLLIAASFLLGSMYTKIQLYEKGGVAQANNGGTVAGTGTGNQPQAVAPEEPAAPVDVDVTGAPVKGNKNAKIALVEFTDYQCPFCKRLFDDAYQQVKKDYIDTNKIAYFVRDYPLFQIHPQAEKAAQAAHCAEDQGKFWEYHDVLFTNQEALQIADLKKYAVDLGLNAGQFDSCLDSGKYAQRVKDEMTVGEKVGVQGTPASFIGVLEGNTVKQAIQLSGAMPYASFKSALDDALQ